MITSFIMRDIRAITPAMTDESLPIIVPPTAETSFTRSVAGVALIPSMVAEAGESAAWRYVDFFTLTIRNPNTRRA